MKKKWRLIVAFLLITLLVCMLGLIILSYQRTSQEKIFGQQLNAIMALKQQQFSAWFQERQRDAQLLARKRKLNQFARIFLKNNSNTEMKTKILNELKNWSVSSEYQNITLYSTDQKMLIYQNEPISQQHEMHHDHFQTALKTNQITFEDLHPTSRHPQENTSLGFWIPITNEHHTVLGLWLLQINPQVQLYPMIQKWPLPSKTAESLLVRQSKDGNEVVFLHKRLHPQENVLQMRFPTKDTPWLPATKAILGQTGIVEGLDYRQEPVIACIGKIPFTPWYLVCKIDKKEMYAPLYRHTFYICLVIFMITSFGFILLRQRRAKLLLMKQITADKKFKDLFNNMAEGVALHRFIYDDDQYPIDYKILSINPMFSLHTGIDAKKIIGTLASELYQCHPAPFINEYYQVVSQKQPLHFERYFAPLNKHFKISVYCYEENCFATVFEDITLRKQLEERILEERERLLTTLKSIGDGVISTDAQGKVVLINQVTNG